MISKSCHLSWPTWRIGAVGIASVVLLQPTLVAADDKPSAAKQTQHRQLDAHTHGVGSLNIAAEGNVFAIELEVPGADIVGFEHPPHTDQQKAAVAQAKAKLSKPLELFRLPGAAGCRLVSAEVEHETEEDHDAEHAGEHSKTERHGDDDSGHRDHDDGVEKAKDHDEAEDAQHAEFHAEYQLNCRRPASLLTIDFDYFKVFKGAEALRVSIVAPKGQSQRKVTREQPRLSLQGMM